MSLKRTTIIFVSAAALAAWLSAAIAPGRPPLAAVGIAPAPVDASGAALGAEIARLRERLRPTPAPREAERNPFFFRSARRGDASSIAPRTQPAEAIATAAAEPPLLRLTLAGVAEDAGPDGGPSVRTAIISGNGQLFLAKEGDIVTDRGNEYRVGTVSADSVSLTALRDGTSRQLALK